MWVVLCIVWCISCNDCDVQWFVLAGSSGSRREMRPFGVLGDVILPQAFISLHGAARGRRPSAKSNFWFLLPQVLSRHVRRPGTIAVICFLEGEFQDGVKSDLNPACTGQGWCSLGGGAGTDCGGQVETAEGVFERMPRGCFNYIRIALAVCRGGFR